MNTEISQNSWLIENLETLLNLFGKSLILKDASKDFERLREYDTFTRCKFASKLKTNAK